MKYLMELYPYKMTVELIKNKNKEEYVDITIHDEGIWMYVNLDKNKTIELRDLLTELINKMKDKKD